MPCLCRRRDKLLEMLFDLHEGRGHHFVSSLGLMQPKK